MREADEGAPEGMVYVADEQTAGRGRGAHGWHSARGAGLYVSVLLRPRVAPADILWLSLAAGLAVRDAVRQVTSLEADIRWPNDLLFGKKKFCGILTELNAEVTRVRHAVVGIGINVHQESFPGELSLIASSLRSETGRNVGAAGPADRFVTIALPGSASAQHGDNRRGLEYPQPPGRRFYLDSRQACARG
jgi:BirA family biotin operon repressor/biotin-[acetyl-CoA-carboxylase] ligase